MALKDTIRVMVVDDMTVSRQLITMGLDKIGVKNVVQTESADSALRSLETAPCHLVISDYNMPGKDGLEFLLALRKNERTRKVGCIMVTGQHDPVVVDLGKRLGMHNYLTKPFSDGGLRACIEAVTGPL